jgi:putative oxidoreductase
MVDLIPGLNTGAASAGLLLGRLVVGLGMAAHGAQKLFGWFGGHGLPGTAGYFESLGFRPGKAFAVLVGLSELTSGILVALGLLSPVGPALMLAVMIVAMTQTWQNGFFALRNGIEVPLLYASAAVALSIIGPGRYSVDAAVGLVGWSSLTVDGIALVAAVLGAIASLALRRPVPAH